MTNPARAQRTAHVLATHRARRQPLVRLGVGLAGCGAAAALVVCIAICGGTSSVALAQQRLWSAQPKVVPGAVVLYESDRIALQSRLERAVYRAEASQMPPEPYRQVPLTYDGAVVAMDHDGLAFLTTAGWLTGAHTVDLLIGETRHALTIEAIDTRFDLAILRPSGQIDEAIQPVTLADHTPVLAYALIAPHTKYEQLTSVSVIEGEGLTPHTYWSTTLPASNGYPMLTGDGRLVGLHARRSPSAPREVGHAVGWPVIDAFLHPPQDVAVARAPDRVHVSALQKTPAAAVPAYALPAGLR